MPATGATTGATHARAPLFTAITPVFVPAATTGPTAPMWTNPARPSNLLALALAEAGDAMACRTYGDDSCEERREAGARGTYEKASTSVSVARHARWQSLRMDVEPEEIILPSRRWEVPSNRWLEDTTAPPLLLPGRDSQMMLAESACRLLFQRARGTEWYLLPGLCGDFRTVGPRKGQASQRCTQRTLIWPREETKFCSKA